MLFFLTLSVPKDIELHLRTGSRLSLTVTNLPSFGDFSKIKKQLTKLEKK